MSDVLSITLPQRVVSARVIPPPESPSAPPPAADGAAEALHGLKSSLESQREALRQREQQLNGQVEQKAAQFDAARQAMEEAARQLAALKSEIVAESEEQLLDLAVEIARKVLMQEIQAQRYEIEPIVKEVLLRVPARQEVTLRMHPEDLGQFKLAQEEGEAPSGPDIHFVADPRVERASCVVETAEGLIESTPEDNLQEVSEILKSPEAPDGQD
jgi:flagellar assembly protein FliH